MTIEPKAVAGAITIRGGTLLDGTGGPPRRADVSVDGDRIAAVGNLGPGAVDIDATGKVIAPGFIDVHSHDDYALLLEPSVAFKIGQGVTTCVIGNCGIGAVPFGPGLEHFRKYYPDASPRGWGSMASFTAHLRSVGPAVNVAPLAAHGMIRSEVMGQSHDAATARDLVRMQRLLEEALTDGAFGLTTGLVYAPGCFADSLELAGLCRLVAEAGGTYATHMRNEADHVEAAIDEAIATAAQVGVRLQISHLKTSGRRNHGKAQAILSRLEAARDGGIDVHHDAYPYTSAGTHLDALMRDSTISSDGWTDGEWGDFPVGEVLVASCPNRSDLEGASIGDLASKRNTSLADIVAELIDEGSAFVTVPLMAEADVWAIIHDANCMIGSDGVPTKTGRPHPRLYGTFARVLRQALCEGGLQGASDVVRRMTSMPASAFGIDRRGQVSVGCYADIVVFDPEQIKDEATYLDPRRTPSGIDHVVVNGSLALFNGIPTDDRNGVVLRGPTRSWAFDRPSVS